MTPTATEDPPLLDYHPEPASFLDDVREGLQAPQKFLPSKYFYDARGSHLFDEITRLPEYYPTRTEVGILRSRIGEIAARIGPRCLLVEYGSGSSAKTHILLDALPDLAGYVPIDIAREHLMDAARRLAETYPGLRILPVCADYTTAFTLPYVDGARPVVFFPGSTVGNFMPDDAVAFLRHVRGVVGRGGGLLIGVDLKKDPALIEAAYNDARGVTAAFNKNLLRRINRELGGTFDLDAFAHHAFYNAEAGRIEMHLVSRADQEVRIGDLEIPFREDETIRTEYSYKYSLDDFAALAETGGFDVEQVWTDDDGLFSVQDLVAR